MGSWFLVHLLSTAPRETFHAFLYRTLRRASASIIWSRFVSETRNCREMKSRMSFPSSFFCVLSIPLYMFYPSTLLLFFSYTNMCLLFLSTFTNFRTCERISFKSTPWVVTNARKRPVNTSPNNLVNCLLRLQWVSIYFASPKKRFCSEFIDLFERFDVTCVATPRFFPPFNAFVYPRSWIYKVGTVVPPVRAYIFFPSLSFGIPFEIALSSFTPSHVFLPGIHPRVNHGCVPTLPSECNETFDFFYLFDYLPGLIEWKWFGACIVRYFSL